MKILVTGSGPELPYPSTQNRLMQIQIPRRLGHAYSSHRYQIDRFDLELAAELSSLHGCSPVPITPYLGVQISGSNSDRKGQYSVRINGQWRICFRWSDDDATDVEIVDYHKG